jgi:multiple sugar transport system permease protein
LTPITFYLGVVNAIAAFQVFTPTYLLTGGGPEDATLTTSLYTYQAAFVSGRLGYASAMTLVTLAFVVLLTLALFRYAGRRVQYLRAD